MGDQTFSRYWGAIFSFTLLLSACSSPPRTASYSPGLVEFRWINEAPQCEGPMISHNRNLEARVHLEEVPLLDAEDFVEIEAYKSPLIKTKYHLRLRMNPTGKKRFHTGTAKHAGKRLAVIIDGKLNRVVFVKEGVTSSSPDIEVMSFFKEEDAKAIAEKFNTKKSSNSTE